MGSPSLRATENIAYPFADNLSSSVGSRLDTQPPDFSIHRLNAMPIISCNLSTLLCSERLTTLKAVLVADPRFTRGRARATAKHPAYSTVGTGR